MNRKRFTLIFFVSIFTFGYGQPQKLDSTNSSEIRFQYFGFDIKDTVIIKVNDVILFDTTFTKEMLREYSLLRLKEGSFTISISSRNKAIDTLSTFILQSDIENKFGKMCDMCNTLWLGYVSKHNKVENYRQKTIDSEFATKVREWHLHDKVLQQKLRKTLEDNFDANHGNDLDYKGKDEHYSIHSYSLKRKSNS